ncbi:MAG: alpha-1,2-fucosyltransferase [Candidatus Fonsibacter ubiquis]
MISFNSLGNYGHLGNQMFQYAALKGLSIKYNRPFVIPPTEFFGKEYYTKLRSNIDECFHINCDRGISNFSTVIESSFSFDENLFNNFPKENANLLGFFQSNKWFKHINCEIKKDFTFIPKYFDASSELREDFSSDLACLHIRRTDYLNNPNHNCQSLNYYKKAIEQIPSNCEILIFSDDPYWCKRQKVFSSDRFLVSETNNPYIDMCLMSMCDYIIIASSTFSWWGAYLSKAKKVFAPKEWFGPNNSHLDTKDIYCENWGIL